MCMETSRIAPRWEGRTNTEQPDPELTYHLLTVTSQQSGMTCGKVISPCESASLDHPKWLILLFQTKVTVHWSFTQRHYSPHLKEGGKVKEGNNKHHKPQEGGLRMWGRWVKRRYYIDACSLSWKNPAYEEEKIYFWIKKKGPLETISEK